MTDSEKELVKEARGWKAGSSDDSKRMVWLLNMQVDAIERLVRERDEARAERDRDCIALGLEIKALRNDAEAAEAEAARLREAFEKVQVAANVLELMEPARHQLLGALQICWDASRSALEAKHD